MAGWERSSALADEGRKSQGSKWPGDRPNKLDYLDQNASGNYHRKKERQKNAHSFLGRPLFENEEEQRQDQNIGQIESAENAGRVEKRRYTG